MSDIIVNMSGSVFCVDPLEQHLFIPSTVDHEYCQDCRKPRSLHLHDGFSPGHPPSYLSTDPTARYRGAHPRFRVSPSRREDSDEYRPSASLTAHVQRQRSYEQSVLSRVLSRIA